MPPPRCRPPMRSVGSRSSRVDLAGRAGDDPEEPGPVDADECRGHLGAPTSLGALERVLIHPNLRGVSEPLVGRDERVALVDDGLVGARPADPERSGRLGDGIELLADAWADLPAGLLRQRRPATRCAATSPTTSLVWARLLAATPSALGPHEHRRCAGDRQVPHEHPPPVASALRQPGLSRRPQADMDRSAGGVAGSG